MGKSGPHICEQCGNEFMGWAGNPNKYCSRKCANEAKKTDYGSIKCETCGNELTHEQKKKYTLNKEYYERKGESYGNPHCSVDCARESRRVPKVERTCKRCGKKFLKSKWDVENHNRGHYCSQSCAAKTRAEIRSKEARIDCKCQECGKKFTELRVYVKNGRGKYCSYKCRQMGSRNRVNTNCANCGEKIEVIESEHKRKNYCSQDCWYEHSWYYRNKIVKRNCKRCGDEFDIDHHRLKFGAGKYCSKLCKSRDERKYDSILTDDEYQRFVEKAKIKILDDSYIKNQIQSAYRVPSKHIPKELIELKRLNIKRKRIINNHK